MRRTCAATSRRSRTVLSQAAGARSEASGHARWFERLLLETAVRAVDRGCSRGAQQASEEAKDRSRGRAVVVGLADGKPLSSDLGAGCGESGPVATAVASASYGADAYAGDESVAGGSSERRDAA